MPIETPDSTSKPVTPEEAALLNIFMHHPPTGDQTDRYERIRQAAFEFAKVVVANTPQSGDQTTAIRKISEAQMTANAAIARNGQFYPFYPPR